MCPGSMHAPMNGFMLSWFNSFSCRYKSATAQCPKRTDNTHPQSSALKNVIKCAVYRPLLVVTQSDDVSVQ